MFFDSFVTRLLGFLPLPISCAMNLWRLCLLPSSYGCFLNLMSARPSQETNKSPILLLA